MHTTPCTGEAISLAGGRRAQLYTIVAVSNIKLALWKAEQPKMIWFIKVFSLSCRDLKAANMLVADDGHILLADFGACATLEREARLPSLQSALNKDSTTPEESPTGEHLSLLTWTSSDFQCGLPSYNPCTSM